MPRTDRVVRMSNLRSYLITMMLFPFLWGASYVAVMVIWSGIFSVVGENSLAQRSPFWSVTERGMPVISILLALMLSRIFCNDLRRQPTTPDGRYCAACGYDLTGNTSGTCPECGDSV